MPSSEESTTQNHIKYDSVGLPLMPQPSNSYMDPLNYPTWLKFITLAQVGLITFIATLNVTIVNPAVVPLAKEFHIEPVVATYQTTIDIGVSALGPLLFTPFADVYGRRPAYLMVLIIGTVSNVGSAIAKSYGTLILARAFNGFGTSSALGLGAGTVVDLFFVHQRGKAMGFFTLMLTNGAHISPIIGGYVTQARGWRWCFWVSAFLNGIMFFICIVLLPETLYARDTERRDGNLEKINAKVETASRKSNFDTSVDIFVPYTPPSMKFVTYVQKLRLWTRAPTRKLAARDFFVKPLSMFQYPTVAFPAIYYGVTYGYASIEAALTVATLFTRIFKFNTVSDGLANGVSLLIGATLGEICAGPVTDLMMQRARKKAISTDKIAPAEIRLHGIYLGAFTVPAGLLIYGFTIQFGNTFIAPCIGMAIACFGVQIVSSVTYTYSCGDCHQSRSNDVSLCFHVVRQLFGLPLGFYSIPLGDKIGYHWSFIIYATICIICFFPIAWLIYRGRNWKKNADSVSAGGIE